MEWDHLWKCRSEFRKKFAARLKKGATLPHRETCVKLMRVIKTLMTTKLARKLLVQKAELGDPHVGAQDDIWSMRNCRESYGCMRISLIIKEKEQLMDVNPLISFAVFESSSHTGKVIAAWKQNKLAFWELDAVKSVTLWTEDGAANNIKSSKILNAKYEVCGPHNFQRANLFALGIAGSVSENPGAKALIGRMGKQSSSFHVSGNATKGLQESQVARGIKAHAVKSTESANATRWTGIFRCAQKSRLLESDIKIALTGEVDGICAETPAEIEDSSGAESDGGTEGGNKSGSEKAASDVESDAEQVAANRVANKKFPLAHRCLEAKEWKLANQLESVALSSHESVMLMQKGTGVDPGTVKSTVRPRSRWSVAPRARRCGRRCTKRSWTQCFENTARSWCSSLRRASSSVATPARMCFSA
eukprot:1997305-Prymnesium_polylepis.1